MLSFNSKISKQLKGKKPILPLEKFKREELDLMEHGELLTSKTIGTGISSNFLIKDKT